MKELMELVEQSLKEQLENGTFKKIVDEAVTRAIRDSVQNAFSWNGSVKKYLNEQMDSIMLGMMKQTDFTEYVETIKYTINKALPETALPEYQEFVKGLQKQLGTSGEKYKDISVETMLNKYCEFIKDCDFSQDDFYEYQEDNYAIINCGVELCQEGNVYNKKEYLYFKNDVNEEYNVKAYIRRWYDGDVTIKMDFDDVLHLNGFELYLLQLQNNYNKITNLEWDGEEEVEVELED